MENTKDVIVTVDGPFTHFITRTHESKRWFDSHVGDRAYNNRDISRVVSSIPAKRIVEEIKHAGFTVEVN